MAEEETKTKRKISESQVPPHILRKIKQQEEEIRKSQEEFIFLDKSDECERNGDLEGAIDWLKKSININDTQEKRKKLYNLEERFCQKKYELSLSSGNIKAAIDWLIKSINYTNTEQKRRDLRELYMKQYTGKEDPTDYSFREVINANIENGKLDYAHYLKEVGRTADSIHWFVAAGEYERAFQMVDLRDEEALKRAVSDFQGQENNYSKTLSVALHENVNVNKMFNYQKWPAILPLIAGVIAFMFTDDLAMQIGLLLVPVGAYMFKNHQWDKYNAIWKQLTNTPALHWQLEPLKEKFEKNEMEGVVSTAIGLVFLINVISSIGGCLFSSSSEDETKSPEQPAAVSTESTTQAPPVKEEKTSSTKEPPVNSNEFNLSLGNLKLGDSIDQMHKILGAENKISDSQTAGHKHYEYKDVVVTIKDDSFIEGLVTYTDEVKTEKGLKQGSSLKEVLSSYGRECVLSEYDGTKLYEYPFESAKGNCAVLRFAIKNNIVDYISLRLVDNAEKNKLLSNVKTVNDSTESRSANDMETAKQTFINYHKAITSKNYREAYDTLSFAQRERIGDYNSYVAGFTDTISSEVSDIALVSSDGDAHTFDYTLTARDRYQGRVKVQTFKGQVTMAKDNGRWYVRYAKSSKVNERIE